MGRKDTVHQIWVAEIKPEEILGLDFIRGCDCQLTLNDGQYELEIEISDKGKKD